MCEACATLIPSSSVVREGTTGPYTAQTFVTTLKEHTDLEVLEFSLKLGEKKKMEREGTATV